MGLAGNQTSRAEGLLRSLALPVDLIGTSDGWGAEKPGSAFSQRMIGEANCPAEQILYVGDRLDNDVRPAQELGIPTAVLRRGPWGYLLRNEAVAGRCLFHLDSLAELPDLASQHNAQAG